VSSRLIGAVEGRLDVIKKNPAARAVFTHGGVLYKPGELLVQRDLGRTLRNIAVDPQSFYTGEIARAIASDMTKNGGLITLEDLNTSTSLCYQFYRFGEIRFAVTSALTKFARCRLLLPVAFICCKS